MLGRFRPSVDTDPGPYSPFPPRATGHYRTSPSSLPEQVPFAPCPGATMLCGDVRPQPKGCHCEARRAAALRTEGEEAIATPRGGDCFASLAMTERTRPHEIWSHTLARCGRGSRGSSRRCRMGPPGSGLSSAMNALQMRSCLGIVALSCYHVVGRTQRVPCVREQCSCLSDDPPRPGLSHARAGQPALVFSIAG
jgi:hypothetical protein